MIILNKQEQKTYIGPEAHGPTGLYRVLPLDMLKRHEAVRKMHDEAEAKRVAGNLSEEHVGPFLKHHREEEAQRWIFIEGVIHSREKNSHS